MTIETFLAGLLILVAADPASAQGTGTPELRRLSLEELGNIEVTTVSRSPETVAHAPAAVFVITREDIRRSGATSIPEALRLAPGVQVTRIDSARWAIGMRGFADRLARSMLVLIDGRAVYSPLFAGTYWEVQDTLLEDIDRIEVIRGPGGTLWGANAINGIINIITRAAKDTQGALVTGQGGSAEYGSAGLRYGGAHNNLNYRAYGKVVNRGPAFHADGSDYDHWRSEQGGVRIDRLLLSTGQMLTLQGDAYHARSGQQAMSTTYASPYAKLTTIDATLSGANVLARWSSPANAKTGFQLQAYYDRTNRDEIPVKENRDTFDVDVQQTRTAWPRQDLVWGLGYRVTSGRITAIAPTQFFPGTRTDQLSSAFVQDEITVAPERVRLAGGAKLEHNGYSGFEIQPSGRVLWTPNATNTVIGSVTRAVRTPSRVETDYSTTSFVGLSGVVPVFVRLLPNQAFVSEKLVAYEVGYRVRPASAVYLTLSSFYNKLNDVLSTEVLTPFFEPAPSPPHLVVPVEFGNGLHGNSHGAEITADVRVASWWRLNAGYSYLRIALSTSAGSTSSSQEARYEGLSPSHQWQIRPSVDFPRGWSLDGFLRYISGLPAGPVPGYASSNVRVAWRPVPRLEVAVVGKDLYRAHHLEWPGAGVEVPRSGHATVTWGW